MEATVAYLRIGLDENESLQWTPCDSHAGADCAYRVLRRRRLLARRMCNDRPTSFP